VTPPRPFSASSRRNVVAPRARGWRSSSWGSEILSVSPRASTSFRARSSCRRFSTPARSKIVRKAEVTGMPSTVVASSVASEARCPTMPSRCLKVRGLVTSGRESHSGTTPHSWPAARWLSTAPDPDARIAAIHRPRRVSASWPTAYTPRWSTCSLPRSMRQSIALGPAPSARSCQRATTPCCRRASSATHRSSSADPPRPRRELPLPPIAWSREFSSRFRPRPARRKQGPSPPSPPLALIPSSEGGCLLPPPRRRKTTAPAPFVLGQTVRRLSYGLEPWPNRSTGPAPHKGPETTV
jgi:hypothetical protein